ncbi:MAG: alpha/beta fold hydrolase [Anaerolineae bacterium]
MSLAHPSHDLLKRVWYRPYTKPHQPFKIRTQDGITLAGVHLAAEHNTLIIYCHGFLGGKNYTVVPRFVEMLAEEVDVIAFDFRGHGESEGLSTLGEREVLDVDAVMGYARGLGYRRILLVGSSMGGATVLRYAAMNREVAGVATIGAFAHPGLTLLAEMGLWLSRYPFADSLARVVRRCCISPDLRLPSPLAVVHEISPRPLLMFHGEFDLLIPVQQGRELYAAAGEPKELVVIPHGDHDIPNLRRWARDWIMEWVGREFGTI